MDMIIMGTLGDTGDCRHPSEDVCSALSTNGLRLVISSLSWPGSRGRDRHQRRRLVLVTRCCVPLVLTWPDVSRHLLPPVLRAWRLLIMSHSAII